MSACGQRVVKYTFAHISALSPLGVRNFLGDENLLPMLSEGSCDASPLGK